MRSMRVNMIGKSNLLAINNKIDKCESLVQSANIAIDKFVLAEAKKQADDLRAIALTVGNLHEHSESVRCKLNEFISIKQVIKTTIETRDLINDLLKEKKVIVSKEQENSVVENKGRIIVECEQELDRIEKEMSDNSNAIRSLLVLFDELCNLVSGLEWYSTYIGVYSDCMIDNLTDEELQTRMLDLRLRLRFVENEDNELIAMIEQAMQECKKKLKQAGYVFVNPFLEWSNERLQVERENTQNLLVSLYDYSNTMLNEIMSGADKERVEALEYCDKEIQRAIILAEDKKKAIDELLNRKD